jgi:hypothetical protein
MWNCSLGPLLFSIIINDHAIINYAHLFSDDTTFVTKGKNINLLLEVANNSLELA